MQCKRISTLRYSRYVNIRHNIYICIFIYVHTHIYIYTSQYQYINVYVYNTIWTHYAFWHACIIQITLIYIYIQQNIRNTWMQTHGTRWSRAPNAKTSLPPRVQLPFWSQGERGISLSTTTMVSTQKSLFERSTFKYAGLCAYVVGFISFFICVQSSFSGVGRGMNTHGNAMQHACVAVLLLHHRCAWSAWYFICRLYGMWWWRRWVFKHSFWGVGFCVFGQVSGSVYWVSFHMVDNTTGWRRPIGCLKLQVISRKRATNYRALLWKMTFKDTTWYVSSPPCTTCYMLSWKYRELGFKKTPLDTATWQALQHELYTHCTTQQHVCVALFRTSATRWHALHHRLQHTLQRTETRVCCMATASPPLCSICQRCYMRSIW